MPELIVHVLDEDPGQHEAAGLNPNGVGSPDESSLLILHGGDALTPEVISPGEYRYSIEEDVDAADLALSWRGAKQPFPASLLRAVMAPDRNAVMTVPSLSSVHAPFVSKFKGRVDPASVALLRVPEVSGAPDPGAEQDAWKLPITGLPTKQTVNYLEPLHDLRPDDDWAPGFLHELEMNWEPLGWALDEWVSTVSLGPYEDTMTASGWVAGTSSLQEDTQADARDDTATHQLGASGATEHMRVAAREQGRQTGFSAGLGQSTSSSVSLSVVNPVAALAQAVTGAIQLGFSTSSIDATVGSRGDLRREVVNSVETRSRLERERSAAALARSAGSFTNSRQLRALRNLAGPRALNLAHFTVVRHWLVTTLQSRVRPVLLIRAEALDEPFTHQDVFLHREVLQGVLLDSTLGASLTEAANSFQPRPAEEPATETITSITIRATVADPAEGRRSKIELGPLFTRPGGTESWLSRTVDAVHKNGTITAEFHVDEPLDQLTGWRFTFLNPGTWNRDDEARLEDVEATLHLGADEPAPERVVRLGHQIRLHANSPRTVTKGLAATSRPSAIETDPGLARVLAHLDADRTYYRLAIDLAADPSQRFHRLARRAGTLPMPLDLRPVGVTGAHLAFLTKDSGGARPDSLLDQPITQLAATPAGGTFMEAIGGGRISTDVPDRALPQVVLPKEASLVWPELQAPTPLDRSSNGHPGDTEGKGPEMPSAGDSQLAAQLTSARESLAKIGDVLKGVQEQVAKSVPPAEANTSDAEVAAEPSAASSPAKSTEKDDKTTPPPA